MATRVNYTCKSFIELTTGWERQRGAKVRVERNNTPAEISLEPPYCVVHQRYFPDAQPILKFVSRYLFKLSFLCLYRQFVPLDCFSLAIFLEFISNASDIISFSREY